MDSERRPVVLHDAQVGTGRRRLRRGLFHAAPYRAVQEAATTTASAAASATATTSASTTAAAAGVGVLGALALLDTVVDRILVDGAGRVAADRGSVVGVGVAVPALRIAEVEERVHADEAPGRRVVLPRP